MGGVVVDSSILSHLVAHHPFRDVEPEHVIQGDLGRSSRDRSLDLELMSLPIFRKQRLRGLCAAKLSVDIECGV